MAVEDTKMKFNLFLLKLCIFVFEYHKMVSTTTLQFL